MNQDILLMLDGDMDAYERVGNLLESDSSIVTELISGIWEKHIENQASELALECLSCYGGKKYQTEINENVIRALYTENNSLLFCSIACYPDVSSELRLEHMPRIEELISHSHESVRRAAIAEFEWMKRQASLQKSNP